MRYGLALQLLLVVVYLAAGCAVPKRQSEFEVGNLGGADSSPFRSNRDLLASGLVNESLAFGAKGRLFESESRLRKALALTPDNGAVAFNLAVVLSQQGNTDEALGILRDLRAKEGDKPRIMVAIADAHLSRGELDRARDALKVAFASYAQAQNAPQAALMARSIANLAFAAGNEQEALCYSHEALLLAPSPQQLGYHASLLVGLNQYAQADLFVGEQLAANPALSSGVLVHLARALARAGIGNDRGALDEVKLAQDFISENAEFGTEVQSLWWLLKRDQPDDTPIDDRFVEREREALQVAGEEAARLREKPSYHMLRWPPKLLTRLETP
jgi:tetratricopeptide (TPR) repeat protein